MNDLTPRGIKTAVFPIKRKTSCTDHLAYIEAKLRVSKYGTHHKLINN